MSLSPIQPTPDVPSLVRTKIDAEIGLHQSAIEQLRKLRSSLVPGMESTTAHPWGDTQGKCICSPYWHNKFASVSVETSQQVTHLEEVTNHILREYTTIVELIEKGTELGKFRISYEKRPCTFLFDTDKQWKKKSATDNRKLTGFPPAPEHVKTVLGEDGAEELRKMIYWKVTVKQRLNPTAYDTTPI